MNFWKIQKQKEGQSFINWFANNWLIKILFGLGIITAIILIINYYSS